MTHSYKAPHPVYHGGMFYNPGEAFTTDAKPGKAWEKIGAASKVAAVSPEPVEPVDPVEPAGDVPLEEMHHFKLAALARAKGINPKGMPKPDVIAAIKAAE